MSLPVFSNRQCGPSLLRNATSIVLLSAFAMWAAVRPSPDAESRRPPPAEGAPSAMKPADQGRVLFGRNCAHCHGEDGRGDEGPSLHDLAQSDARLKQIIQRGIKGEMPRFVAKFSDAEIRALIAYLRTLKN